MRPADVFRLDNKLAGFFGLGGGEVGIAGGPAKITALLAQRVEIAEPLDVALAAAGHAGAQPVLLVVDFAVELVLLAFFLRPHLVPPRFKSAKAPGALSGPAAVEPPGP